MNYEAQVCLRSQHTRLAGVPPPLWKACCLPRKQSLSFNIGLSKKPIYEGKSSAPAKLKSDLNTFQNQAEMAFGLSMVVDYSHHCSPINKQLFTIHHPDSPRP